jgi:hypothetical protein
MNLVDAMGSDFAAAKKWAMRNLVTGAAIYVVSLTVVVLPPGADKLVAILVLLAQVFTIYARAKTDEFYSCGETIRRAAMLQDGLGIQPSALVIADLCARLCLPESGKPTYLGSYYASPSPTGPKRLAEILLESAFWTKNLSRKAEQIMWWVIAVTTTLIVCIAIVFLLWGSSQGTRLEDIAKILVISLGFWTLGDWAVLALKYRTLAQATEPILSSTEKLVQSDDPNSNEALILLGEYNAALACGPIIPQRVYEHYQNRFNKAWSAGYSSLK